MAPISRLYSEIFCDLYGTIFDIRTEEDSPRVWDDMLTQVALSGAHFDSGSELFNVYKEVMAAEQERGEQEIGKYVEIDFVKVWQKVYQCGGVDVKESVARETSTYFHRISTVLLEPYPHAREFLTIMRRKGIRPILVSNAQESWTLDDLDRHHLRELFDEIYLSSIYGVKKPDKRFFDVAIGQGNIERSHVVYLGNEIGCDVLGATQAGLDAIYLHTPLSVPTDPDHTDKAVLNVEGPDFDAVLSWLCNEEVAIEGEGESACIVPR